MKVNKIFAEEWTTEADKNEPEKKKRNEQTPTLAMNRRSALWIFFRFFSNRFLKIGFSFYCENLFLFTYLYRGTQRQFSEKFCSEDDLRSRIFGTFFVKFLDCLPPLGFSNI